MGKLHTLRVEDCCLPALELPLDDSIAAAPAVAVAVSVAVVVVVCVSVLFRGVSPLLNPHSDLAILTRRIRRFRAGARDRYSNTFEVIP